MRLGEQVAKDMASVRISPDIRFAVVGKSYLVKHDPPKTPQDLVAHSCINLRLPTYGGSWAWDFERGGRELEVRVDGQLTFNSIFQVRDAALEGLGLGYIPEDVARPFLSKGRLVWVLQQRSPPCPGYRLYYQFVESRTGAVGLG